MNKRAAVILRSFAKTSAEVEDVVNRTIESIRSVNELLFKNGEPVFQIMVAVPLGKDCGETTSRMRCEIRKVFGDVKNVVVIGFNGDPNSEVLNNAIGALERDDGIGIVAIVSNKAIAYLTPEVVAQAIDFIDSGMHVVGVHITDLDDALEVPIDNTCAFWNTTSLFNVGRFDSNIGVEGITPMARLMKRYGDCAVLVQGSPVAKLDVRKSGEQAYAAVRGSKRERQELEAARVGVTLEWINSKIRII